MILLIKIMEKIISPRFHNNDTCIYYYEEKNKTTVPGNTYCTRGYVNNSTRELFSRVCMLLKLARKRSCARVLGIYHYGSSTNAHYNIINKNKY